MWTPTTRWHHCRMGLRDASDLSDAEWSSLEPLPHRNARCRCSRSDYSSRWFKANSQADAGPPRQPVALHQGLVDALPASERFAIFAIVARLHPVAAWVCDHDEPARSIEGRCSKGRKFFRFYAPNDLYGAMQRK
jgi:hypothetical protein